MIITIAGTPGSGKSTAAKYAAEKLGLKQYSVGDFRRQMAEKRSIGINELNKLGEKDFFTDKKADEWQKNLGKKEDNFVIDGRLSFFFIPDSIKVFLEVDENEAAGRIFRHKRNNEKYRNLNDAIAGLRKRQESDIRRYEKYYSINPFDKKHYDLVIDTTRFSVNETGEKIVEFVKNHQSETGGML